MSSLSQSYNRQSSYSSYNDRYDEDDDYDEAIESAEITLKSLRKFSSNLTTRLERISNIKKKDLYAYFHHLNEEAKSYITRLDKVQENLDDLLSEIDIDDNITDKDDSSEEIISDIKSLARTIKVQKEHYNIIIESLDEYEEKDDNELYKVVNDDKKYFNDLLVCFFFSSSLFFNNNNN